MTTLLAEHESHLRSRGYNDALLEEDQPFSIQKGEQIMAVGIDAHIKFWTPEGGVAWICRSLSGATTAIHTGGVGVKDYRVHASRSSPWLPIFYGSKTDIARALEFKTVILTEGLFDRIAVKRAVPDRPVWARLTKGVGQALKRTLARHTDLVVLAFDEDEPGQKATVRATRQLTYEQTQVIEIHLSTKDPSEYLSKNGEEKLRRAVESQLRISLR